VFGYGLSRHRKAVAQLIERLSIFGVKPVQQ
jgi:hypothetical protein